MFSECEQTLGQRLIIQSGHSRKNLFPTFSLRMRESLVTAEPNFCIEVNGEMSNFRNRTAILKTSSVRPLI
jgi:hypothetical protein